MPSTCAVALNPLGRPVDARHVIFQRRALELQLTGEADEPAHELVAELPGAHHAVIEGAGHLAPLEQPERFRELLLGFLSS